MSNKSARVDTYIARSADFARPILEQLRDVFHEAAPGIEEDIKWGIPAFMHKGIVSNLAAFKHHVSLGFWKGKIMQDPQHLFEDRNRSQITAIKLKTVEDIPPKKVLVAYIREAVELNEKGIKLPATRKKNAQKRLSVPGDLSAALKSNPKAAGTFKNFSYTNKKEYLEWITGARQEKTRSKRLATAIEWMSEGKPRNWKYMSRKS